MPSSVFIRFHSAETNLVEQPFSLCYPVKRNVISREMWMCASPVRLMIHHIAAVNRLRSEQVQLSGGQLNSRASVLPS